MPNSDDNTNLPGLATPAQMTSREIADLVDVRHDSARRTIERLAERGVIALPPTVVKPTDGRPTIEYVFSGDAGKRDSYVVVAQLSPEFTARLVDRWQELESAPLDPQRALSDPSTLRHLLLENVEKVLALQSKVAELAPKVEAFDRIANTDGSVCVTDAAKALQVRPKDLFAQLQVHHWIYRRVGGKGWLGYQAKIQTGLVEHKVDVIHKPDGTEAMREQVRITPKGMARLAELLAA